MSGLSFADLIEASARAHPDAVAQIQGTRRTTWGDLYRRSNGLAAALLERGVKRQDKVAQYMYNCPEYMESLVGAFIASLVPVNTNYRYQEAELFYLWENADVVAVFFHASFAEQIEPLRSRLPAIHSWICVDDSSGVCPDWAIPFEELADCGREATPPWKRDGDDLLLLYTGGTTGMPKGVMWRHDDFLRLYNSHRPLGPYDLDHGLDAVVEQKRREGPGRVTLPASPLMHGNGLMTGISTFIDGGTVVTLESRRFDPTEMLDAITRFKVELTVIVGDAFARPLLEAIAAHPDRWDLSSLFGITSSGAMWSEEVKRGLLRYNPSVLLLDALGSSESFGMALSESSGEVTERTARFKLGDSSAVLDDEGKPVAPGSKTVGRIAVRGYIPVGYYKDPEKSAQTFPVYDGVRWAVAGDYATVEADGSITLLGRGSLCINTGGEKVFPEEVEEVLKEHPEVRDAVVVGLPHQRFGESLIALVEPEPRRAPEAGDLIAWTKDRLASYKAPREVLLMESIGRSPSGKVDYAGARELARRRLGGSPTGNGEGRKD